MSPDPAIPATPQAEQALRDSEARHRAIFETAVDGIITIDENGIIETVNPAAQRQFGYAAEEMMGKNVKFLMPSPDQERHDGYLQSYFKTGVKKIIGIGREVVGLRKDGSTFPMDLAVSEFSVGSKRMFTGLIHDLSDRKKIEQEREELLRRERAARAEAERANVAKDEFLAALSHELRTPLTPALLTLTLLERDPATPPHMLADLETIRRHVELEAHLINDLLDLTRIVNGKLTLRLDTLDVHDLIANAERICRQHDGIHVKMDLGASRHHVRGDAVRLQQVFWNLISNAHKFTPIGGTVTIRTENAGDQVQIQVIDTGRGIESERIARLFSAFEQGDPNVARRFGGLGLGLAISKAIVAAHHGEIDVRSDGRGKGSTFTVRLDAVTAPTDATAVPATPATPTVQLPKKALRILLVEDHEPTLNMMTRLLKQFGHTIQTAGSVKSAVEAVETATFDLMISDLGLPDGSGCDVMRHLSGRSATRGIALSGYGMREDIEQSLDAGFAMHLTKPVDLQQLLTAVGKVAPV
jgi:PAS domain S-box-containing protein